ncbi:MAG: hypothetical protein E2O39_11140 [Planctomycetota bacterium]|nr:MAG: hypothetical protein E2O39_11140 [Planctomycetota bacterium]
MLRNPRFWLPAASLGGVLWLLYMDLDRTSPGPITPTHAQVPELVDSSSCETCHGSFDGTLAEGCATCHVEIGADLADGTGFHGTLADVDAQDCGHCHGEHYGAEVRLVNDRSYALAGIADRTAYDHAPLNFTLAGRHAELACSDCHEHADARMLAPGEKRYLGLERACVACHEDVHEGRMARDCAACHGQVQPFAEVAVFAHARFVCEGSHDAADCAACHEPESDHSVEALASFDPPTDERACRDCHESPHSRAFTTRAGAPGPATEVESCGLCHAAVHDAFAGHPAAMPVELHGASGFELAAPHDQVACADCHGTAADAALVDFADRYPGRGADECAACHTDVHGAQFDDIGFLRGSGCLACHERHSFRPSTFDVAEHALTSFELAGSHAAVACSTCHEQVHPDEPRVFHGTPADCASCHADAHRGALVGAEEGCAVCHAVTLFSEFRADAFDHDRFTSFELDGAHARAECESCHRPARQPDELGRTFGFASEVFGQPVDACATCHTDPHWGAFDSARLPGEVEGRAGCARCHLTESFREPALESFDHESWTGYPLDGAHARAECDSCHRRSELPDELGRTFGRVHEVFGQPVQDCRTCHADPHRGAFADPELPAEVSGRESCSRCHTTESFRELWAGAFDHELWTGYPIAPFHASTECTDCHAPVVEPGGRQSFAHAAGNSCSDCHADPHVGQFIVGGRTDCARCHLDAGGLDFDHGRDTRFALDETHTPLECSACHIPWPIPGGEKAVRYKPLGIECSDCHGPEYGGGR